MRRDKRRLLFAGMLAAWAVGACATAYASTSSDTQAEQAMQAPQDDGSVMAQVIETSGSTLTVYLESRPDGGAPACGEAPAEGETPPELPEGETAAEGETPPEPPEGETPAEGETPPNLPEGETAAEGETPPELPEGEAPKGGGGMHFAESSTSLTLTDSTVVTKGMGQESASVSDLASDTVVRLVLDSDGATVVSINIMDTSEE